MAQEQFYDDVCAPSVEIVNDGRALVKFVTDRGPLALLMNADVPVLLSQRVVRALNRSGHIPGIWFVGDPPYDLPAAQSAEVQTLDETVELTLRVIVSGALLSPTSVRVRMTAEVALALARQMVTTATKANSPSQG
jgi:hypothetical protein